MLARVSDSYFGIFGLYNADTNSSIPKTRKSAPFEVDDALFEKLKKQGVLIEARLAYEKPVVLKTTEPAEELPGEDGEDDIFSGMTYKELCAEAKEHGIKTVGVSRGKIIEVLKAAESTAEEDEMPVFEAEEPV